LRSPLLAQNRANCSSVISAALKSNANGHDRCAVSRSGAWASTVVVSC
jgi:hypothetical protein